MMSESVETVNEAAVFNERKYFQDRSNWIFNVEFLAGCMWMRVPYDGSDMVLLSCYNPVMRQFVNVALYNVGDVSDLVSDTVTDWSETLIILSEHERLKLATAHDTDPSIQFYGFRCLPNANDSVE